MSGKQLIRSHRSALAVASAGLAAAALATASFTLGHSSHHSAAAKVLSTSGADSALSRTASLTAPSAERALARVLAANVHPGVDGEPLFSPAGNSGSALTIDPAPTAGPAAGPAADPAADPNSITLQVPHSVTLTMPSYTGGRAPSITRWPATQGGQWPSVNRGADSVTVTLGRTPTVVTPAVDTGSVGTVTPPGVHTH